MTEPRQWTLQDAHDASPQETLAALNAGQLRNLGMSPRPARLTEGEGSWLEGVVDEHLNKYPSDPDKHRVEYEIKPSKVLEVRTEAVIWNEQIGAGGAGIGLVEFTAVTRDGTDSIKISRAVPLI